MQLIQEPQGIGTPIILYGGAGIGKSTLASQAPKPVFIDIENGIKRIPKIPRTPVIKQWEQFQDACKWFLESEYKTIIVDTLDVLEQLLHRYVCRKNQWKSIEQPGFGKGYAIACEEWMKFCDYIDICTSLGKNMILIAHETVKSYAAPDADMYDRYNIKINKASANLLSGKVDAVLFAQLEMIMREDKTDEERVRAITTGKRILRCSETPAYNAKNRFGLATEPFDASIFDKLLFAK